MNDAAYQVLKNGYVLAGLDGGGKREYGGGKCHGLCSDTAGRDVD